MCRGRRYKLMESQSDHRDHAGSVGRGRTHKRFDERRERVRRLGFAEHVSDGDELPFDLEEQFLGHRAVARFAWLGRLESGQCHAVLLRSALRVGVQDARVGERLGEWGEQVTSLTEFLSKQVHPRLRFERGISADGTVTEFCREALSAITGRSDEQGVGAVHECRDNGRGSRERTERGCVIHGVASDRSGVFFARSVAPGPGVAGASKRMVKETPAAPVVMLCRRTLRITSEADNEAAN